MKTWTYSWIIYPVLYLLACAWGSVNTKVRETMKLRSWKHFLSLRFNVGEPIDYWVHVASAGELEYAVPILSELGRRGKRVLITYYSVSAKGPVERLREVYPNVSLVVPLPHDGLGLMKEFVQLVRRQGVHHLLLMKYELWPGLLWECNRRNIKVLLVDALKPSWFHRRLLHKLDSILSGYESEVGEVPHPHVLVVGDTRVERVLQRLESSKGLLETVLSPALRDRLGQNPTVVCGSMWPPDTKIVCEGFEALGSAASKWNVVWVPHELDAEEEKKARARFAEAGFSAVDVDQRSALPAGPLAVIVMKKGILVELYRLGRLAYVGGGFGSGVHSVWEPALCGARVACGPGTERSPEAGELQKRGLLRRVQSGEEFASWLNENSAVSEGHGLSQALGELIKTHVGASQRVVEYCERTRAENTA